LPSGALDLERKVQCGLMLQRALLEAQAQIFLDQRQVDSSARAASMSGRESRMPSCIVTHGQARNTASASCGPVFFTAAWRLLPSFRVKGC